MTRIPTSCPPVNAKAQMQLAIREAEASLRQTIALRLNEILLAVVCHVLSRPYHRRRQALPSWVVQEGICSRCKTHQSRQFSRNGFRPRQLLSRWGELNVELPRVRCQCGGSVQIDFGGVIRPYQRICDEVDEQIQRWGQLCLSLREMRTELEHLHIDALGLRTLNERLHLLKTHQPKLDPNDVPPVLKVDAIWATQLRPNGQFRRDRKGRLRPIKGRCKRPILIAMGVWPETGRCAILAWQLAENEEEAAWIAFLGQLEAQGIRGANGLQVVIHDGGSGLCSALRTVYFDAEQQRCLFHKLRNIWQALQAPDDLSPKQSRRHRKAIFRDFRAIWEAQRYDTALRRYLAVVRKYRSTQPKAVATLRRDFRATVTYYHLLLRFPSWRRAYLRTTSRLERFNRRLRCRLRAAAAFHSDPGILAMVAQEAHTYHASQAHHEISTE